MRCANWLSREASNSNRRHKSVKAGGIKWNCEVVGSSFVPLPCLGGFFPLALCMALPTRWDSPHLFVLYCTKPFYAVVAQLSQGRARMCRGRISQKKKQTRLPCNIKLRASQRWRCHDEYPCVCGFPSRSRRGHFCVGGRIPKACFYFWSWHDCCDDLMIARGWSNQRFSVLEPDDPFCSPLVFRRVEAEHSLFLASFGDLRQGACSVCFHFLEKSTKRAYEKRAASSGPTVWVHHRWG